MQVLVEVVVVLLGVLVLVLVFVLVFVFVFVLLVVVLLLDATNVIKVVFTTRPSVLVAAWTGAIWATKARMLDKTRACNVCFIAFFGSLF